MSNIEDYLEPAVTASFVGYWQRVSWIPDIKSGELFNIGVVVIGDDGTSKIKLLDDFKRLNCLFDGKLDQSIKFINQTVQNSFPFEESPFRNVILSEKMRTKGGSIDQCLDRLFGAVVSLAVPKEDKSDKEKYTGVTQEKFLEVIRNEAKHRMDAFVFHSYFTESSMFMDGEDSHFLRVPINGRKLASLASCCYATPDTAENKLKDALVDLSVAANLADNKEKPKRIFALLPSDELAKYNKEAFNKIYNVVDEIHWKANKVGIILDGHEQIDRVIESVIEYCE